MFRHAVGMVTDVVKACFEDAGVTAADLDWFVPHQANRRIIDASADKLGIAREKVVVTVDRHANTSAASIPLALDVAVADGRIKPRRSGDDRGDGRRLHLGRGADPLVSRRPQGMQSMRWTLGIWAAVAAAGSPSSRPTPSPPRTISGSRPSCRDAWPGTWRRRGRRPARCGIFAR